MGLFGFRKTCFALFAASWVAACNRDVPTYVGEGSYAPRAVRLGATREGLTFDEEMLRVASAAPGFAGYFVDATGDFVVAMNSAADVDIVLAALDEHHARVSGQMMVVPLRSLSALRVKRVDFSFDQLYHARTAVTSLLNDADITQVDIDEVANRVVIGVDRESALPTMRMKLQARGLASRVQVEVVGRTTESANLQGYVRPVPSGVQINRGSGVDGSCSLGYNAYYRNNEGTYDGERYFLTASHCTDSVGFNGANVFGQPDIAFPIGVEVSDPPFFSNATNSACPTAARCRYSDAALVRWYKDSLGASPWRYGEFPTVGSSVPFTISGYRQVLYAAPSWDASMQALYVGLPIEKTGRKTGRTTGTISHTCVTTRVYSTMQAGAATDRWLLCQFQATNLGSDGGDSGGPVYKKDGSGHMNPALGLLWGKSYVNNAVANNGIRTTFSWLYLAVAEISTDMGGGWLEYIRPMWGVPGYW